MGSLPPPPTLSTLALIPSTNHPTTLPQGELDELEREEFFRLKKVQKNKQKQLAKDESAKAAKAAAAAQQVRGRVGPALCGRGGRGGAGSVPRLGPHIAHHGACVRPPWPQRGARAAIETQHALRRVTHAAALPLPPQPADPFANMGGVDSKGDGVAATSMLAEAADEDLVFA